MALLLLRARRPTYTRADERQTSGMTNFLALRRETRIMERDSTIIQKAGM
jgi:hypothetical protein